MADETPRDRSVDALLKAALPHTLAEPSAACVDAEVLAAWADASLPAPEAALVDVHVSSCARCQALVAALADAEAGVASAPAIAPFRERWAVRWVLPAALGAAAVLAWMVIVPGNLNAPGEPQTMARVEPVPEAAMEKAAEAKGALPAPLRDEQRPAARARSATPAPALETGAADSAASQNAAEPQVQSQFAQQAMPAPPSAPPPPPGPPQPPPPAALPAPLSRTADAGRGNSNPNVDAVGEVQVDAPDLARQETSRREQVITSASAPSVTAGRASLLEVVSAETRAGTTGRGGAAAAGRGGNVRDVSVRTSTRWRVTNPAFVQRSANNGISWDVISLNPPAVLLAGSAPSPTVCWFVGRGGVVLRTVDAQQFVRVAFPEAVDLTQIAATSETAAVVTTADGRAFATTDGGATWTTR